MENLAIPNRIIRKIKDKAPCFSYGENFNRYPGVITEGHETSCQYKNVIIYIQKGHSEKKDFFEKLIKSLSKIQTSGSRKYRLFIFGIGYLNELEFSGKYFELNSNIRIQKKKIIEELSNISENEKYSNVIISELFPKSQGKNFYTSRTKINNEDLLIIIGNKGEISINENLKSDLKKSIRKHILLIEFDNNDIDYIFYPKELNFRILINKKHMDFKRNFKEIKEILKEDLFLKKIKPDCEHEKVFMTIRNNYLDFYHKGGRLFKFNKNGFQTHIKYAAVIQNINDDYLTQSELNSHSLSIEFDKSYSRIKENCANFSGIEATGVSRLFHKYSYLSNNDIVVLDIEVSFKSADINKKQDRIDILLYNIKTRELQFVEAKHYSNKEIWSNSTPDVISQLNRYERQVKDNEVDIIKEYTKYIEIINEIFEKELDNKIPSPISICNDVSLLIFGFDQDQKKGRLNKLILNNKEYNGFKVYAIGNIKGIVIDNLWNVKKVKL